MITRRIVVSGHVQGVGFRKFIQRWANELQVMGTAMNMQNGDVEIYASGKAEDVDQLIEKAKIGPNFSHVRDCQVTEMKFRKFTGFEIKKDGGTQ